MTQLIDALGELILFAHRHPNISVNDIRTAQGFLKIISDSNPPVVLVRQLMRVMDEALLREQLTRCQNPKVQPHDGRAEQQTIRHIVAAVADKHQLDAVQPTEVLLDSHKVG